MWTVVEQQGGTIIETGFTPMRLDLEPGTTYNVTVGDYENFVFDQWEDGSTERTRAIAPSESAMTITAYYTTTIQ